MKIAVSTKFTSRHSAAFDPLNGTERRAEESFTVDIATEPLSPRCPLNEEKVEELVRFANIEIGLLGRRGGSVGEALRLRTAAESLANKQWPGGDKTRCLGYACPSRLQSCPR